MEKGNRLNLQTERNERYLNDIKKSIEGYEWNHLDEELRIKGFDRKQKNAKVLISELNGIGKVHKKGKFKFLGTLRNGKKHGFGRLIVKKFYIYEGMFEFDLKHGDGKIYDFDKEVWIHGFWEEDYIKDYEKFKAFEFKGRFSRIDDKFFGIQVFKNKGKIFIGFLDLNFNVEGFGIYLSRDKFKCSVYKNRKGTNFKVIFLESGQYKLNLEKISFCDIEEFIKTFLKFFDYNTSTVNLNKLRSYDKKYIKTVNSSQSNKYNRDLKLKNTLRESYMKVITEKLFNIIKTIEILHNKDSIDYIDCNKSKKSSFMENLFSNFWKSMPSQYTIISPSTKDPNLNNLIEENQSLKIQINKEYKEEINLSNFHRHILYSNSDTFEGIIENSDKSYSGIYIFESKKDENGKSPVYEGELYKGKVHGFGVMKFPDGSKYEGEWSYGSYYGIGIFTLSSGEKFYVEHSEGGALVNIFKAK